MVADVEIISREKIKPSSPTPHNLRNLKLSFLDQISPPIYVPLILFYDSDHESCFDATTRAHKTQLLKQSLSNTLTMFYPLAGRIQDNSSVDCDDSGVEFVEARVHARLSDVISDPYMEELKKFLAVNPNGIGSDTTLLAVQINFFHCGGFAIGVCLSHKIADGTSLVAFIDAWASTCRGDVKNISQPCFDLAQLFPPRELSGSSFTPNIGMTKEKIVTKRFLFNKEKLGKLKETSADASEVKNPTRVEAVSGYILEKIMEVSKNKAVNEKKTFAAVHAVNLRPRTTPTLPEPVFGNCWRPAIAFVSTSKDDNNNRCHNLGPVLRNAIRKIDRDYIEELKNGEYLKSLCKSVDVFMKGDMEFCNFSSWCRFPVYEVDYGWGRPCWACTTTMPFKNVVILMSTPCGDGIEAWVNMLEEDMDAFRL